MKLSLLATVLCLGLVVSAWFEVAEARDDDSHIRSPVYRNRRHHRRPRSGSDATDVVSRSAIRRDIERLRRSEETIEIDRDSSFSGFRAPRLGRRPSNHRRGHRRHRTTTAAPEATEPTTNNCQKTTQPQATEPPTTMKGCKPTKTTTTPPQATEPVTTTKKVRCSKLTTVPTTLPQATQPGCTRKVRHRTKTTPASTTTTSKATTTTTTPPKVTQPPTTTTTTRKPTTATTTMKITTKSTTKPAGNKPTTAPSTTPSDEIVEDEIISDNDIEQVILKQECDNATILVEFKVWLVKYNRQCEQGTPACSKLFDTFSKNYLIICQQNAKHSAGDSNFRVDPNHLAGQTTDEINAQQGLNTNPDPNEPQAKPAPPNQNTSDYFNWEEERPDCKTPVKNQGACADCYAFGGVQGLQWHYCLKNGKTVVFSEQQIIDCTGRNPYNNNGCISGKSSAVFQYANDFQYMCDQVAYAYTAVANTSQCKESVCASYHYIILDDPPYTLIQSTDVASILHYLTTVGPVICEFAAADLFNYYTTGVYTGEVTCDPTKRDHMLTIIGYGTENGVDYWYVKNSWSTLWGIQGYGKIQRGTNCCGIEMACRFPNVIEDTNSQKRK